MSIGDFITGEKARLQSLFDGFNRGGSIMVMREAQCEPLRFGLIDSYTVTCLSPHFDAAGNVARVDFWLLFKSVGYNNGFQYSHTIKVTGWSQDDTYLIDLTDDRGRRYHIELIMDATEHDYVVSWAKWQTYKRENAEMFQVIDAQILAEHVQMAEAWDAA